MEKTAVNPIKLDDLSELEKRKFEGALELALERLPSDSYTLRFFDKLAEIHYKPRAEVALKFIRSLQNQNFDLNDPKLVENAIRHLTESQWKALLFAAGNQKMMSRRQFLNSAFTKGLLVGASIMAVVKGGMDAVNDIGTAKATDAAAASKPVATSAKIKEPKGAVSALPMVEVLVGLSAGITGLLLTMRMGKDLIPLLDGTEKFTIERLPDAIETLLEESDAAIKHAQRIHTALDPEKGASRA